jgi:hypothetical protein
MSPAPARQRLVPPRQGAFAAGAPAADSVLGELMTDALKGAAAPPATETAPAAAPEPAADDERPAAAEADDAPPAPRAPRQAAPRRRRRERLSMPPTRAGAEATVPLQAKIPGQVHWDFKIATLAQGSNMTRAATALITVYNEDPGLVEALIGLADDRDISLGELLHEALTAVLEAELQ